MMKFDAGISRTFSGLRRSELYASAAIAGTTLYLVSQSAGVARERQPRHTSPVHN
jgi:uncharacterized membrane protein YeiH